MRIDILTIFPKYFTTINNSILKRAIEKKIVQLNIVNVRDFSKDKHCKVDDTPYGGGVGMLMLIEPIYYALESVRKKKSKVILTSPKGNLFSQKTAENLSLEEHIIIICGHYEGVDHRVNEFLIDMEISIGSYILTNGNLPAMVITDSIIRLLDGVINKDSLTEESFSKEGFLEYPQYTKPVSFKNMNVPEVLFSGNHSKILQWKQEKSKEAIRLKNKKN